MTSTSRQYRPVISAGCPIITAPRPHTHHHPPTVPAPGSLTWNESRYKPDLCDVAGAAGVDLKVVQHRPRLGHLQEMGDRERHPEHDQDDRSEAFNVLPGALTDPSTEVEAELHGDDGLDDDGDDGRD